MRQSPRAAAFSLGAVTGVLATGMLSSSGTLDAGSAVAWAVGSSLAFGGTGYLLASRIERIVANVRDREARG
ncbi:MAG: hypothetical protein B7733_17995 [Myxococcales bacterium FL481]|nr:MAG: hypothetical protein B7733_17995 [Myxococcales bacterium FL481]